MLLEVLGVAHGDDAFGAFVQHHHPVGDIEDGFEFVGDDHHGGAHAGVDGLDQIVQLYRGDGVQAGGRLVEKEHGGVQGHGPGQAGPFLHAAGDFFRQVVLIAGQVDQPELHLDDGLDGGRGQIGVFLEGQGHVFRQGHGAEERPRLKENPEVHAQLAQLLSCSWN